MEIATGRYPALLLNADFNPVSLFPLSVLSWQEAVKDIFQEKVVAVAEYDVEVRSSRTSMRLPSVVALRNYRKVPRHAPFTRTNLWLRDGGACVYCRRPLSTSEVTFDHVVPRSRGGGSSWENIVCACSPCNGRKDDRLPSECGMHLDPPPSRPSQAALARSAARLVRSAPTPRDWMDFIYWDGELETG